MKPQTRTSASDLAPKAHGHTRSTALILSPAFWGFSVLLLLAATGQKAHAQQQYGYGYGSQNPQSAPYGYQQPAQPQYAQPQYQQPGYGQPQYAQPAYPQQPQYGQQPYAAPQQPGQDYAYGDQQPGYAQQPSQPAQAPLSPDQLQQLLAPVALYPDSLLAQILTASTYPEQVAVANQWLQQMQSQGYSSPDQISSAVANQNWDPSVKGLTAFPQVLAMMDQNLEWTSQLGNAYFNQPQDVMQTVQALRQRAQSAGTLQNTPQESMSYDQGAIELAPPTPDYVYVPTYNPWAAYGAPIAPYPGFSFGAFLGGFFGAGLRFGPGIAMAAFNSSPFGLLGWTLSWLAHAVFFHHSTYFTHSVTVADWGYPHGGARAYAGWSHAGHWAGGYRPGFGHAPIPYNRTQAFNHGGYARPAPAAQPSARSYGNSFYGRNSYGAGPQQAYRQPTPQFSHPQAYSGYGRSNYGQPESAYSRPNYDNRFDNRGAQNFAPRSSGNAYGGYRAPQSSYQQRAFAEPPARSFAGDGRSNSYRGFSGGREESFGKAPKNFYGGGKAPKGFGHESFGHEKAPKMHSSGGGGHKHH
jgi:Protein of unknown function (DUF3300)